MLDKLIDSSQSDFIAGRFILDGIVTAQGYMAAWVEQKRRGGPLSILLKHVIYWIGPLFLKCYKPEILVTDGLVRLNYYWKGENPKLS